jgi:hypothetical protein
MTGLENLGGNHLTEQEVQRAKAGIMDLVNSLVGIKINLTAAQRQKYGSINEQNKLFVNKVYDYYKNQPDLRNQDVDWMEFEKDYKSRQALEGMIAQVEDILRILINAKILHDYDNYQAALQDYSYTVYKAGAGLSSAGFETKMNDLKQFFNRTTKEKK